MAEMAKQILTSFAKWRNGLREKNTDQKFPLSVGKYNCNFAENDQEMENQAFENNNIDHESFISEIQAKSVLWDPTSKNKILKEKAWVDISKKLNTSVKKCQNFWKNLRHQNVKKNKTIEQMPSSSAATKDEDFQSMTFLNIVKVEKRSISNFDTASRCTVPEVETSDDGKSEFDQTSMAEAGSSGDEEDQIELEDINSMQAVQRGKLDTDASVFYLNLEQPVVANNLIKSPLIEQPKFRRAIKFLAQVAQPGLCKKA
uniref:MADF domain-containing protein n=1 Tax=Romanomermis culicivorax TaxID=13658 RepID=A0A915JPJ5_ROMCU